MKTGDYRRERAAYTAALERARYDYHTGVAPQLRLAPLRDRYADLWTRDALDDLTRAREETSTQFETERTALAALLRAAQLGHLEARAEEVTNELARCTSSTRFEWDGAMFSPDDVPDALAAEPDATRRRELSARWFNALRECSDLRAARLDTLREAARTFGHDSYFAFVSEITETRLESLSAEADNFLARTAHLYNTNLFDWSARHLPPAFARTPAYADSLFFMRLVHLDPFFPAVELRATYDATMRGLGIRVEAQHDLRLETLSNEMGNAHAAVCFALNPPEDVRLVYRSEGGAGFYQDFFDAAGRAQHFAWVSRDLNARYPELVHAPHEATRAGFSFLFGDLLKDTAWLAAHRRVRPSEAHEIARALALVELHRTRRACVQLHEQRALEQASDPRSEQLAESYATAFEEATGFRAQTSLHLRDLIPDNLTDARTSSARLPPAVHLRARLFSTALGEYLRTRHGNRWWRTRGAADELIDMWNTGSRYTVEELASLLGLGVLDFDLLADSAEAVITRE
jgi:hypothetical protein